MSSLWQQGSSENRSISGRKMNSEDTGIGGITPAVVWTFGKWEDKNASLGNCPWCLAKGQTNALRYCATSCEETILRCTNPVCLYTLVSGPLEDVCASLSKTHEVDLDVNKKDDNVSSTQKTEDMFGLEMGTPIELIPLRPHLFWKNEDNLCWLDSLLVMLVNCRTMREALNQDVNVPDSVARNIFSTYDKTCSYVKAKEQQCEDKVTRVPTDVLEEAERQLSDLRLSLFKLLQPTLKCEIGQEKMPVFALPLILRSDKWAEDLFQHTVRWEFKCTSCGHTVIKSVKKTLTTLNRILSDWHPLKSTHRTQCSNCKRSNQRRRMVLERLSSVFALHFVEGVPRKDLSKYSFEFEGTHYNVSTAIQYNKELKHFVTWIRQSNGSWLELDDLKYPNTITHERLTFRAKEIHIVFWEAESNAATEATQLPVPQCSAIVPAVVPNLPVASSLSSDGPSSSPQKHIQTHSSGSFQSAPKQRHILKYNKARPAKSADQFSGFLTKKVTALPNSAGNNPSTGSSMSLTTIALLEKLKKKKKKLAKLNQLLANRGQI